MQAMSEQYNNDAPIETENSDQFDRFPFAQKIARVIASRNESSGLVIGIFGKWGEGKTSVLNLIETELSAQKVVCIRYNPWRYTGEEQLLRAFYFELAEGLNKKLTYKREDVALFTEKYIKPFAKIAGYGESADGVTSILGQASVQELRVRLNEILIQGKTRLVIFIDDIDRLDKIEMSAIFRLVKLNADFSNTVYVLAFDDEAVAHALSEQYGSNAHAGKSFLEKIIQVPLHLPIIPRYQLTEFCFNELRRLLAANQITFTAQEGDRFANAFWDGLEPMLNTPRMARLYANVLQFSLPLLQNEANVGDLMLIDGIRIFYPDLHEAIHRNAQDFLIDGTNFQKTARDEWSKILNDIITNHTPSLDATTRKGLHRLLGELFPGIRPALEIYDTKNQMTAEETSRQKRICSPEYFQRYFSYCIPEGDISDFATTDLLQHASDLTTDEVVYKLEDILRNHRKIRPFVSKLQRNIDLLASNPAGAAVMAEAIARCGSNWPKDEGYFYPYQTIFTQAAQVLGKCVGMIVDPVNRAAVATAIISQHAPLPFAVECLSYIHWEVEERKAYPLIEQLLIERILKQAESENFMQLYGVQDAIDILLEWRYRQKVATRRYLGKILKASPHLGIELLKGFVERQSKVSSKKSRGLNRDTFETLATLIESRKLLEVLRRHFATDFKAFDRFPYSDNWEKDNSILAHQLAWFIAHPEKDEKKEP